MRAPQCGKGCSAFIRDAKNLQAGTCHGWGPFAVTPLTVDITGNLVSQPNGMWPPILATGVGCPKHPDWPAYEASLAKNDDPPADINGTKLLIT